MHLINSTMAMVWGLPILVVIISSSGAGGGGGGLSVYFFFEPKGAYGTTDEDFVVLTCACSL